MAISEVRRRRGRPKDAMSPAERRAQLLDAALTALRRDGPEVSMDAIAAEAGITKPVLYNHFGGRSGLASALADEVGEHLAGEIEQALDPQRHPYVQLRSAIDVYTTWVHSEQELFSFFVSARLEGKGRPSVLRISDRVAGAIAPALALYYELIGRPTEEADLHAHGIVGMVYVAYEREAGRGTLGSDRVDVVTSLTDFVWAAISSDSPPTR